MKKLLLVVLAMLMMIPAFSTAETIDLDSMTLTDLYSLRDKIDSVIAQKEQIAAKDVDYTAMSLGEAMDAIGLASKHPHCVYRGYEDEGDWICIHVDIVDHNGYNTSMAGTIQFTIDFCRMAFPRKDVHTLLFRFHQEGRNNYGRAVDTIPIIYKIKEATFNKMDADYFYEYSYATQKLFLNAVDSHAVYAEYKREAR